MLKSGHKQREESRKRMKHRIKDKIRTELATEIVNLADMVLIRERRLLAGKGFDTYRSVVEGRGGRRGMTLC